MRLVVLDTHVIVSAGIVPDDAPAKLLMDSVLEGAVHLVTCPAIVSEYRKVIKHRRFGGYDLPPLWLEFLIEESMCLPDPLPWPYPGPNPSDQVFLALALLTGAWVVTGNLSHFPPGVRGDVMVISAAGYRRHLWSDIPDR